MAQEFVAHAATSGFNCRYYKPTLNAVNKLCIRFIHRKKYLFALDKLSPVRIISNGAIAYTPKIRKFTGFRHPLLVRVIVSFMIMHSDIDGYSTLYLTPMMGTSRQHFSHVLNGLTLINWHVLVFGEI
jgi:hypothetical protein